MSYEQLRSAVLEDWEAIPEEFFMEGLVTASKRLQAVIMTGGKHTSI